MSGHLLRDLTLEQLLSVPKGNIPSKDTPRADRAFEECRPEETESHLHGIVVITTEAFVQRYASQFSCLWSWDRH